jgi:hypothetical protein
MVINTKDILIEENNYDNKHFTNLSLAISYSKYKNNFNII